MNAQRIAVDQLATPAAPQIPVPLAVALGDGSAPPAPQEGQRWSREAWTAMFHRVDGASEVLADLPVPINRRDVVTHVHRLRESGRTDLAFLVVMVWGYGTRGYGPWRAMNVLTGGGAVDGPVDDVVLERLERAARLATVAGPVAGYYELVNEGAIVGLKAPFFTKWLAFTTATGGDPDSAAAAPILDSVVSDWIADQTGHSLRANRTVSYATYVAWLDVWGERPNGRLSRAVVERTIFEIAR